MSTFIMFGKYSSEALKEISAKRTEQAKEIIAKFGGEIISMYALLGSIDLLMVVNMPNFDAAAKVSIALTKRTGISFSTSAAIAVDQFDQIAEEL